MSSEAIMRRLRARLVVDVTCPSCGARHSFFVLDPPADGATEACHECRERFPVAFHVAPPEAKVAYRYLELALDKWCKEFLLISGRLQDATVVVDAPRDDVKKTPTGPTPLLPGLPSVTVRGDGGGEDDESLVDEGRLTHYRKGTGAGVEEIRELLKNDPDNRQMKEWLAFALYTNDMYDDAIGAYLELIETKEADPISHYYLANSYFRSGYVDAAREEWKRVIDLAPDSHLGKKASERIKAPRL